LPRMSELIQQVTDELCDDRYSGQSHYDKNTYANGCRGPLCRKAERDAAARRYAAHNPDRKARPRKPEAIARDAYLNQVINLIKSQPPLEAVG